MCVRAQDGVRIELLCACRWTLLVDSNGGFWDNEDYQGFLADNWCCELQDMRPKDAMIPHILGKPWRVSRGSVVAFTEDRGLRLTNDYSGD